MRTQKNGTTWLDWAWVAVLVLAMLALATCASNYIEYWNAIEALNMEATR